MGFASICGVTYKKAYHLGNKTPQTLMYEHTRIPCFPLSTSSQRCCPELNGQIYRWINSVSTEEFPSRAIHPVLFPLNGGYSLGQELALLWASLSRHDTPLVTYDMSFYPIVRSSQKGTVQLIFMIFTARLEGARRCRVTMTLTVFWWNCWETSF